MDALLNKVAKAKISVKFLVLDLFVFIYSRQYFSGILDIC